MNNFDYQGALDAGYSEDEIKQHLGQQQPKYKETNKKGGFSEFFGNIVNNASNFVSNFSNPSGKTDTTKESIQEEINPKLIKKNPKFDVQSAIDSGYSVDEINDYLEENSPKRSKAEKGGRLAVQYGLGVLSGSPSGIVYDIAAAPLASKEAQMVPYRENVMQDIERLQEQKQAGVWDPQDQELYDNLIEQMKDTSKSDPFIQTADVSIRGLAEKATGLDLEPEGFGEKAANWAGFIKNPKNAKNLFKIGMNPKTLTKAIFPGPTEAIRGLSAGAALQMAEDGQLGPLGTIGSAIVGDIAGHAPTGKIGRAHV